MVTIGERVVRVESDVIHIKGKVDEVKVGQREMAKDIKEIKDKIFNGMNGHIASNTQFRKSMEWVLKVTLAAIIVCCVSGVAAATVYLIQNIP